MHAKGPQDHQSLLGEESRHNRVQAKGGERVLADRVLARRAHPGVGQSCSSGGRQSGVLEIQRRTGQDLALRRVLSNRFLYAGDHYRPHVQLIPSLQQNIGPGLCVHPQQLVGLVKVHHKLPRGYGIDG